MPFYFDESIHDRAGFVLGAYVYGPDPTIAVDAAIRAASLEPGQDEFKSSAKMSEHPEQRALRSGLRRILRGNYSYAVVVTPASSRDSLGEEALLGLDKVGRTNGLHTTRQAAYFDEGIFLSAKHAVQASAAVGVSSFCDIHPQQDSRIVRGLQLADLVAHTCALMLVDTLGLLPKRVKAGPNSGYDPDLELDLGFELWASVRYQFFNGGLPEKLESNNDMVVDVEPYGLHVADSCGTRLREAALYRFGKQYLGCIH